MDIITNNANMEINLDEYEIFINVHEKLNRIANTLDENNYHRLLLTKTTGEKIEIYTTNLREIAETIEMLTYGLIEIY